MISGFSGRVLAASALVVSAAAFLSADTLVLRDGRRVEGELIAVRNGTIEFQERGPYNPRTLRISRDDVRRIELDEYRTQERQDYWRQGDERSGASRPGGMRERDVTVSARDAWTDTGIDVREGQVVYFEARGEITWGPGRHDGPEGERNSPYNEHRPIPNRPAASLIGRVGADPFFIGNEKGPIRVRASGRLFLGVNDDYLQDNRGSFRVTVAY